MARIRSVKPAFWSDDDIVQMSRDARLLALGLISMADDEGRFVATHHAIAGFVFPQDDDVTPKRLQRWLDEITATGMVEWYNVGSRPYGYLRNFRHGKKHQRISKPQPSQLPTPPSPNGSRRHSTTYSGNEYENESESHSVLSRARKEGKG